MILLKKENQIRNLIEEEEEKLENIQEQTKKIIVRKRRIKRKIGDIEEENLEEEENRDQIIKQKKINFNEIKEENEYLKSNLDDIKKNILLDLANLKMDKYKYFQLVKIISDFSIERIIKERENIFFYEWAKLIYGPHSWCINKTYRFDENIRNQTLEIIDKYTKNKN